DKQAGEVIAVARPDVAAELGVDAGGAGGVEEPPDLVDEMAAPVVKAAAAEGGLVPPAGAVLSGGRADATGPLVQAALDVDQVPEDAGGDGLADRQEVQVPPAVMEYAEDQPPSIGVLDQGPGLGQAQ